MGQKMLDQAKETVITKSSMELDDFTKELSLMQAKELFQTFKGKSLLSVEDIANHFNVSMPIAYGLFQDKDFPTIYIGKTKYITIIAFAKWLAINS